MNYSSIRQVIQGGSMKEINSLLVTIDRKIFSVKALARTDSCSIPSHSIVDSCFFSSCDTVDKKMMYFHYKLNDTIDARWFIDLF